jgi:hypothetical protein
LSPNTAILLLTVFADVKGAERKAISWMEKFGEWKHLAGARLYLVLLLEQRIK